MSVKKILALFILACLPAFSQITLISQAFAQSPDLGTFSTSGIDTTGANFIGVCIAESDATPGVFSDSVGGNSNTWTWLTPRVNSMHALIGYTHATHVGSGHVFTLTGTAAGMLSVAAFSGVGSFISENGSDGGGDFTHDSLQPGSITPSAATDLLLTCLGSQNNGTGSPGIGINSGFTLLGANLWDGANHEGGGLAYLVPGSTSAVNPLWSILIPNLTGRMAAGIADFAIPGGALSAGVLSKAGYSGLTTISLTTDAATGGTDPYSYQWQRTSHGGSFPGTNVCTNSTSCTDTGLTPGTTYDYRVVVTDNVSAIANSFTFPAITLFPVDDSHISMTPGNWYTSGSGSTAIAVTNRGGSEFRFGFTGTSAGLVIDTAQVLVLSDILTAWSVDGGARSTVTNLASTISLASGLAGGTHTARFWDVAQSSASNLWVVNSGTPDYVIKILGIQLDPAATMAAPPSVVTPKMIFFGDSITAGAGAGPTNNGDFLYSYAVATATALDSEPSMSGFSASGWNVTSGASAVPPFNSAAGFYWDGQARTLSGVYSRAVISLGRNDSGSIGSTIATAVTTTRSLLGATTKLYVLVPLAQTIKTALDTGMTSYCGSLSGAVAISGTRTYKTCSGDSHTYYIDFGADGSSGLVGAVSYESFDGTHPNSFTQSKVAAYLTEAIKQIEGGSVVSGSGPGPIIVQ